jgi:nucleotide-binding universal stress UspA family protein
MQTTAGQNRIQLKNILYATDFSPSATVALLYAADLARHFGANIFLLHVRPLDVYAYVPVEAWADLAATADAEAHGKAADLLREFPEVKSEVVIREGGVWDAIAPLIEEKQIDLIVLGTSGRSGVEKFLLGSVAEEVFRRASCPVLTVGPLASSGDSSGGASGLRQQGGFSDILYASDFSPASRAAAVHAISLAQEYEARLTLLHVIENSKTGDLMQPEELARVSVRLLDISEEAKFWCKPQPIAEVGPPAEKILEVAENVGADLIVLGARKPGRFSGAATHLPMATAHKIVAHAHCPVLTVRA